MTTTKYFIALFLCFQLVAVSNSSYSQANPNLIPNFDFESMVACPVLENNMNDVSKWDKIPSHLGSPDYFNACGSGNLGVPNNLPGNQAAFSGNGYVGFATYYDVSAFREYISVRMDAPLVAGATYTLNARVSLADNVMYATDGLGFYFSTSEVVGNNTFDALATLSPQVSNMTGNYLGNKNGWSQVTGSFIAGGGELYITIGNFKSDANTGVINTGTGSYGYSYLYIEDIELREITPLDIEGLVFSAKMSDDQEVSLQWEIAGDQNIALYELERSTAVTDRFEKIGEKTSRQSLSTELYEAWDSDLEMGQTYYYRLKAIDMDGKENYSEVRQVSVGKAMDQITQLFPRPVDQSSQMTLELVLTEDQDLTIEIMDLSGKVLKSQESEASLGANSFQIPANGLSQGAYLLRVKGANAPMVEKFWVKG